MCSRPCQPFFSLHCEVRPNSQILRIARARGLAQPSYRAGAGDSMLTTAFFALCTGDFEAALLAQPCLLLGASWSFLNLSPLPYLSERAAAL